jgi:hypothetical protein
MGPSSGSSINSDGSSEVAVKDRTCGDLADLRVFWGPEICRLEYLVHLLDTGRIKDEHWQAEA